MTGFVYIMSNPAFPKLLKIGKTKNLARRRRSLSTTGSPFPYKIEFWQESSDYHQLEKNAQLLLRQFRVNKRREFFEVDVHQAKTCIIKIAELLENGIKYLPMQGLSDEELSHIESPWSTEADYY